MSFFQSEEKRVKRTVEEERDLARRLSKKILLCRLFSLASAVLIIVAVVTGLAAMLLGKDSGAWALPLMMTCGVFSALFYWMSRKNSEGLGFMRATLKDYRDFLEKTKGKA